MTVFWRLLLAHLLTDFTFQTNDLAMWKRKSVWGVLAHSTIFLVLSLVFCWPFLGQAWWKFPGYVCLIFLFAIHFVEDYYRIISIQKSGSPDNTLFFFWDQFIHVIMIFLFSPLGDGKFFAEKPFVILSLAVMATHFTSILIYYIEQEVYGDDLILNRLRGKYFLIGERLLIFLCFLLPGYLWAVFPVVYVIRPLTHRNNPGLKFTRVNVIVSNVAALGFGVFARVILLS
jgi:hypothetical protein